MFRGNGWTCRHFGCDAESSRQQSRFRRWQRRNPARGWAAARAREDESGLTTLEWLLIVAAVAGLAALAIVLVTRVVDDTSEQISGSSARVTAARLSAQHLLEQADAGHEDQPVGAKTYGDWARHYKRKCGLLEITYADTGITVDAVFRFSTSTAWPHVASITATDLVEAEKIFVMPTPYDLNPRENYVHPDPPQNVAAAVCRVNPPDR